MNDFQNNGGINNLGNPEINNHLTNNQPVNNMVYDNQPSMNNQYNNYNNSMNQVNNSNKKMNKIFLIIGVVVLVVLIIIVIGSLLRGSSNSNADYTCTMSEEENNIKKTIIFEGTFNYKNDDGSTYQLSEHNKLVIEYADNGLTDSKYNSYMKETFGSYCMINDVDCTSNHVKLKTTSLGYDTVIDRNDNKITITYNRYEGLGYSASKSDKNSIISGYKKEGFTCK